MWGDNLKQVLDGSDLPVMSSLNNVSKLLITLANIAILVGVGLSFIGLAVSLFSLIVSLGDPKAVEKARNGVTWSVLAMLVCALAYTGQRIFLNLIGAGTAAS